MTDKEMAKLIAKTQKATSRKHLEKVQQREEESQDLDRLRKKKDARYVDLNGERDMVIADAPPEDLFRIMAKRDF